jgi:hypothetical protein
MLLTLKMPFTALGMTDSPPANPTPAKAKKK